MKRIESTSTTQKQSERERAAACWQNFSKKRRKKSGKVDTEWENASRAEHKK